ncbi:MAG: RNA polymerase sigma factor [Bacteroidaceae bacterium]|nr:RNA polymerase sigma factor [Bacteroidaceae bacterium]
MKPRTENITDAEILSLYATDSEQALRVLYLRDSGYLNAVCHRYICNDSDAEDVLQDSFLKIFGNIGKYKSQKGASLRSWMSRVVANNAIDLLRKQRKLKEIPACDYQNLPDEDPDLDGIPIDVFHKMIRQLPDVYRAVLNLHVFEEKTHKEIARILGIKENTSYSHFHRAKNLLADKIKRYKQLQR